MTFTELAYVLSEPAIYTLQFFFFFASDNSAHIRRSPHKHCRQNETPFALLALCTKHPSNISTCFNAHTKTLPALSLGQSVRYSKQMPAPTEVRLQSTKFCQQFYPTMPRLRIAKPEDIRNNNSVKKWKWKEQTRKALYFFQEVYKKK